MLLLGQLHQQAHGQMVQVVALALAVLVVLPAAAAAAVLAAVLAVLAAARQGPRPRSQAQQLAAVRLRQAHTAAMGQQQMAAVVLLLLVAVANRVHLQVLRKSWNVTGMLACVDGAGSGSLSERIAWPAYCLTRSRACMHAAGPSTRMPVHLIS